MAANSTSWTKETAPKVPKGTGVGKKHTRTRVKELLNMEGVEKVQSYMMNEGADRLIQQLNRLKGRYYVHGWTTVADYFLPKLQRVTIDEGNKPPTTINNVLNVMHINDKAKLLEVLRQSGAMDKLTQGTPASEVIPFEEVQSIPINDPNLENSRVGEGLQSTDNEVTKSLI